MKLPFVEERGHYRKPQLAKMQRAPDHGIPRLNGHTYNTTHITKADGMPWKSSWKGYEIHSTNVSSETVSSVCDSVQHL